jgi:hypothetical protein
MVEHDRCRRTGPTNKKKEKHKRNVLKMHEKTMG